MENTAKNDWLQFVSTGTARSFDVLSNQVNEEVKERLAQSQELNLMRIIIAQLDSLRAEGETAVRDLTEQKRHAVEDQKLKLKNIRRFIRRDKAVDRREKKRAKYAVSLSIKQFAKQKKKNKGYAQKQMNSAIALIERSGDLKGIEDLIREIYINLNDGYQYLTDLEENNVLPNYKKRIAKDTVEIAKLEKQLARDKKQNGNPFSITAARKEIARLQSEIAVCTNRQEKEGALLGEWRKTGDDEAKAVLIGRVELASRANALFYEVAYDDAKLQKKAKKLAARLDYRLLKLQKSLAYEEQYGEAKNSTVYYDAIANLDTAIAKAKQKTLESRPQVKELADKAEQNLNVFCQTVETEFEQDIVATKVMARTELAAELTAIEKKGGTKRAAAKDRAYAQAEKQIALAAYRLKFLRRQMDALKAEIRGQIYPKNRDCRALDRDIKRFYQPEEIIKDPNLVNTASLRLVIVGGTGANRSLKTVEKGDKVRHTIGQVALYTLIIVAALIIFFPFYWMLITSLKTYEELREGGTPTFLPGMGVDSRGNPRAVMWSNYVDVFDKFDFFNYLTNTLVVGISTTIIVLFTCIVAAFAFAKLKFKGRDTTFNVFLATMMIPGEMMVITNYMTVSSFGWVSVDATRFDAYIAMVLPFCVSVFYIYLLRQNFKQIPNELYLAAKVDGKTDWQFLWKVMVPLCTPTLMTIGILGLMGSWNAYVWPSLVASKAEYRLISNGLRMSFSNADTGETHLELQMAAAVLVTVPLLLFFIIFRKYIMKGVGRAGIKG